MIEYRIIPLGDLLGKEYNQEMLEESFKKFSCLREKDLEDFLIRKAIPYEKTNYGKTYLIIDNEKLEKDRDFSVMAYFTIAQKSIDISNLTPKRKRKVLGEYPGRDGLNSVPTYLIGQLGRCDNYQNSELSGKQILNECYHSISMAARVIGGNTVVLECRECMFEKFYEHHGFKKLYDQLSDEGLYTLYKRINFDEYWDR